MNYMCYLQNSGDITINLVIVITADLAKILDLKSVD